MFCTAIRIKNRELEERLRQRDIELRRCEDRLYHAEAKPPCDREYDQIKVLRDEIGHLEQTREQEINKAYVKGYQEGYRDAHKETP